MGKHERRLARFRGQKCRGNADTSPQLAVDWASAIRRMMKESRVSKMEDEGETARGKMLHGKPAKARDIKEGWIIWDLKVLLLYKGHGTAGVDRNRSRS
jgi:hypothetical protein